MKWFLWMCMTLMTLPAMAAQRLLVPVFTPRPEYPSGLIEQRYPGKVRILLTIKSDGTVAEVTSLESSHLLLTQSVEHTFGQWRFRPWDGGVDAPLRYGDFLPARIRALILSVVERGEGI